jgi:long-chain acyl-CoA synthetase
VTLAGPPLAQPVDLTRLLAIGLSQKPNDAALVSLERTWSWRELDEASTRLARN